MAKETITKAEYLQVVGLLVLGKKYLRQLDDTRDALDELLAEGENGGGHCSDAIWEDYDADQLLDRLNIKVQE